MKNPLILILIALVLVSGIVFLLRPSDVPKESNLYMSEASGIEFSYPARYFIAHESSVTGERNQRAIVLAEDTAENRSLFSDPNSATEGPPTITIMLFQNNLDNYSAQSFVESNSFSNFKLSDGKTTDIIVGGGTGLRYDATGLYENKNVVVARPDYVYMFTVFFNAPTDQIIADFDSILKSVKFSTPLPAKNDVPTSADNAPPGSIHKLPVPPAVAAVRKYAATKLGVNEGVVIVMTAYEREWSDSCLGLGGPSEICAQVMTPGYEVTTQSGGTMMTFRTNVDGSQIREKK